MWTGRTPNLTYRLEYKNIYEKKHPRIDLAVLTVYFMSPPKKPIKLRQMSISVPRWIEFSCVLKVSSPFFIILPQAEGSVLGPV